jgi:hypothetical protein
MFLHLFTTYARAMSTRATLGFCSLSLQEREKVMDAKKQTHKIGGVLAAIVATTLLASTAYAAPGPERNAAQSALEQYRDMTSAERADLINEAVGNADMKSRAATADERALMAIKPSEARRYVKQEGVAKRAGSSSLGREFRHGNSVGKVLGTSYMMERKIALTPDGKHLETCGQGTHKHDAKTTAMIEAAREALKGIVRE